MNKVLSPRVVAFFIMMLHEERGSNDMNDDKREMETMSVRNIRRRYETFKVNFH